ncbi:Membrane-bound lytic murein transglycosylase D precursor [hydrothermal vent metagenome]|uniref:Membrane-bound lytic murein transglycosylase D n=1 Tax=hydrothermal vent metagenome TaxID=652676 RepID=A0A1W1BRN4_9ZZZZ
MKFKHIFLLILASAEILVAEDIVAKDIVDCRVIISGVTECNPYSHRLNYLHFTEEKGKTLVQRMKKDTLSPSKSSVRIISSDEILDKYIQNLKNFDNKKPSILKTKPIVYGTYTVVSGDALSKIAQKFEVSLTSLVKLNSLKNKSSIGIGQALSIPLVQKKIDILSSGLYVVKKGDTLLSIAKQFNFTAKALVKFNNIVDATSIREGKTLKLPLPYIVKKIEKAKKKKARRKRQRMLDMRKFGKHELRVTATAYTSHKNQTDSTPFIAAWNNRINPHMKLIAISRDLLRYSGIRNGTKVRISGLSGYYIVKDKMNKRYRKRIDIYMGLNLKKARKWGRRSVVIYW